MRLILALTDNQLDRSQDSHTYLYDTAQRFTKIERGTIGGTPSFYQGYTLDGLANWSSFNNNGSSESRSHDVMNAITARGATSLTNDLNGNLANDGNQKYIWDELNRLVEVRDSGNTIICDYYYNADNLRVEKHHAGGAKEQFYYDGATVLVETDGSQTKVREYVNGGQYIDEVILVENGSTYNYYMSDLRFCVTGFIDSTGAVVERARYDGYGKRTLLDTSYTVITTANVNQSYGYTGIRHDNESGLQYYRARYFDNYLGRFINRDPLGYVDGLNLYRGYFVNSGVDPTGKMRYFPVTSCLPADRIICAKKAQIRTGLPLANITVTTCISAQIWGCGTGYLCWATCKCIHSNTYIFGGVGPTECWYNCGKRTKIVTYPGYKVCPPTRDYNCGGL